jgi:hypothetical protein
VTELKGVPLVQGKLRRYGGPGAAVVLWIRHEAAARWRALVVLGVLAGLAGGVAMATVAGARRTATAYQRFRQVTAAPDVIVFATQVQVVADYTQVRKLPEVIDAGEFTLAPIALKEWRDIGTLSPADDRLYRTISRPLLVSGRLPDARRTDEVLVNHIAAKRFHIHVGQHVTIESSSSAFSFNGSPTPDGPSEAATVVGIGDSNMDLLFFPGQVRRPNLPPRKPGRQAPPRYRRDPVPPRGRHGPSLT